MIPDNLGPLFQRHSETSRAAAESAKEHAAALEARMLRVIASRGYQGYTDRELIALFKPQGYSENGIRPRRVTLMREGSVVDSGRRRRWPADGKRGRESVVWVAADPLGAPGAKARNAKPLPPYEPDRHPEWHRRHADPTCRGVARALKQAWEAYAPQGLHSFDCRSPQGLASDCTCMPELRALRDAIASNLLHAGV